MMSHIVMKRRAGMVAASLCLSLAALLASLGTSIANIALPSLALAFDATFPQVQWVVIAYLTALALCVVVAGALGDLLGRKRMLLSGLALFTLASALCGLSTGLWMLVAARALQGAGAAVLMALTIALVRDSVAPERVGRAMGLLGTMSAVGTALGPSLGGMLIGWAGWPAVFLVLVPLGILAAGLALVALPGVAPQGRSQRPDLSLLHQRGTRLILLANLLVANLMMATLLVGPFYLALGLGLQATTVGLVMSVGPVISICTGVPSGRMVDNRGARQVLAFGLGALAAGALALTILPPLFGVPGYLTGIAILTPGYQLFQSANNTLLMQSVRAEQRGAASGLLGLSRNLGLLSGALVMGAVFSFGVGSRAIETAGADAIEHGLQLTFALGGLSLLALMIVLGRRPAPRTGS